MNPLRRLFLGSGRLPPAAHPLLAAEGVRLVAEGVPGSITYRDYRAPSQYSSWARQPFTGSIAITGRRVIVWAGRAKCVDVPHDHPLRAALLVSTEKAAEVCFACRAEDFHRDRSGQVEVRLRTPRAEEIIATLNAMA